MQPTDRQEHIQLPGLKSLAEESRTSWEECTKNPGHNTFIPVGDFDLKHLGRDLQRAEVLEYIKLSAALTVRLRVRHTSSNRPTEGPCAHDGGPCLGTGFIHWAKLTSGQCACSGCGDGSPDVKATWQFDVKTARHVVFDEIEAKRLKVDLYFDDPASLEDGRVKKLFSTGVVGKADPTDRRRVACVTHDIALGQQIQQQINRWNELRDLLRKQQIWTKTVIVVAHPHGQPKMVTVGELKNVQKLQEVGGERQGHLWSYNADTCGGSSGARVLSLGVEKGSGILWGGVWSWAVHTMKGEVEGCNEGYWE